MPLQNNSIWMWNNGFEQMNHLLVSFCRRKKTFYLFIKFVISHDVAKELNRMNVWMPNDQKWHERVFVLASKNSQPKYILIYINHISEGIFGCAAKLLVFHKNGWPKQTFSISEKLQMTRHILVPFVYMSVWFEIQQQSFVVANTFGIPTTTTTNYTEIEHFNRFKTVWERGSNWFKYSFIILCKIAFVFSAGFQFQCIMKMVVRERNHTHTQRQNGKWNDLFSFLLFWQISVVDWCVEWRHFENDLCFSCFAYIEME